MKTRSPAERDLFRHNLFRIFITVIEILLIAAVVMVGIALYRDVCHAEEWDEHEEEYEIMFAICSPGDRVNIRKRPTSKSEAEGWLEPGDMVYLDGKKKNGYFHCVGMSNESGEGWVHKGYLVEDVPERMNCYATVVSKGKLAARKHVGGKRTRWLKPLASVKVYYWSEEWCVTNCGYVQTKYLELEGA